jgi:hypothetical protein
MTFRSARGDTIIINLVACYLFYQSVTNFLNEICSNDLAEF